MKRALVWLRRDLRLQDHGALAQGSLLAEDLAFVFVFDRKLLDPLPAHDRRLSFIHQSLREIDTELRKRGSLLLVRVGDPRKEIPELARKLKAQLVCAARDYEPYAKERDEAVKGELRKAGSRLELVKDQVIFEGLELATGGGTPYRVFTPYAKAWKARLKERDWEKRDPGKFRLLSGAELSPHLHRWELSNLGFTPQKLWLEAGAAAGLKRLKSFAPRLSQYNAQRDFPAAAATSGLSVHLRFGTVSLRACVRAALAEASPGATTWLNELIWRDFYQKILDQFPHVVGHAFKKQYDKIRWPGKEAHFQAWCEGRTGYPLVDAAMRHFNATGWMHNRLRMVVASFLTKDLLVDWRKGEEYFAQNLLDFDLAANNGGWQWCASTGSDAQPYFRIFNPYSQSEKFDPDGEFIRENIPELKSIRGKAIHRPDGAGYPAPIVDHAIQREMALKLFKG